MSYKIESGKVVFDEAPREGAEVAIPPHSVCSAETGSAAAVGRGERKRKKKRRKKKVRKKKRRAFPPAPPRATLECARGPSAPL